MAEVAGDNTIIEEDRPSTVDTEDIINNMGYPMQGLTTIQEGSSRTTVWVPTQGFTTIQEGSSRTTVWVRLCSTGSRGIKTILATQHILKRLQDFSTLRFLLAHSLAVCPRLCVTRPRRIKARFQKKYLVAKCSSNSKWL